MDPFKGKSPLGAISKHGACRELQLARSGLPQSKFLVVFVGDFLEVTGGAFGVIIRPRAENSSYFLKNTKTGGVAVILVGGLVAIF